MTANYTQAEYEAALDTAYERMFFKAQPHSEHMRTVLAIAVLRRLRKVVAFVGADYLNGRDFDPSPEPRE